MNRAEAACNFIYNIHGTCTQNQDTAPKAPATKEHTDSARSKTRFVPPLAPKKSLQLRCANFGLKIPQLGTCGTASQRSSSGLLHSERSPSHTNIAPARKRKWLGAVSREAEKRTVQGCTTTHTQALLPSAMATFVWHVQSKHQCNHEFLPAVAGPARAHGAVVSKAQPEVPCPEQF